MSDIVIARLYRRLNPRATVRRRRKSFASRVALGSGIGSRQPATAAVLRHKRETAIKAGSVSAQLAAKEQPAATGIVGKLRSIFSRKAS